MSTKDQADVPAGGMWGETIKIIVQALILAVFIRIFFFQPFNIPSGSMKGTLLIGDYLFVSKLSYGYSRYSFPWGMIPFSGRVFAGEPKRGDVVVFKLPQDKTTDFIKRVVGMPGDKIQVQNGVLYINDKPVPKKRIADFHTTSDTGLPRRIAQFEETLPNGVKYNVLDEVQDGDYDNTPVFKVPAGHYFMMGDNRDNSQDSRAPYGGVGFVPFENLIGRADVLFFSADTKPGGKFSALRPWTWPNGIRWSRFFKGIH